jgi:large subunit ribosomal protein L28
MPRCEITGKRPVVKNLVSHSNIKTKRVTQPNVQTRRVFSRALNRMVALKLATSTLRSMEHAGGFDTFILNQPVENMSPKAAVVQRQIRATKRRKSASERAQQ